MRVRPPRALWVPFPHGFPLGEPDHAALQHAVIESAMRLLEDPSLSPPALRDFTPDAAASDEAPRRNGGSS